MSTLVGLIIVALIAWAIIAAVSAADKPKPPLPPPGANQVPPAYPPYWRQPPPPPAPPLAPYPPDPGFEILSRTDQPAPGTWNQPDPGGFEPQPVGDFGNMTINLNAVCMLTGSVVRDCRCDQHRKLKG